MSAPFPDSYILFIGIPSNENDTKYIDNNLF